MEETAKKPLNLGMQFFADGGDGNDGGNGKSGNSDAGTGSGNNETSGTADSGNSENGGDADRKFTQDDIDAAVEKRLARERKKWEREQQKQQQTPPALNTSADDGQQAQQAAQPPTDNSAEKIAKANERLIAAEAKAAAIAAGVKPDKVPYVVKLADLDGVDVDEDEGPDGDAIKKAVDKVLKDMPEFKAVQDDNKGSGFQIGANGSNQGIAKQTQQTQQTQAPVKRWNRFR